MLQDSMGLIWIGTQDGLNRYDGYTFKVFRGATVNSGEGIAGTDITDLLLDKKGDIWIATRSGLSVYSYHTNKFINIKPVNSKQKNIEELTSLAETENAVFAGSGSGVVYKIDKAKLSAVPVFEDLPKHVLTLATGDKNEVYAGYDGGGLWKINNEGSSVEQVSLPGIDKNISVRLIRKGPDNTYWVSFSDGLKIFDRSWKFVNSVIVPGIAKNKLVGESILFRKNREVWIGASSGVFVISGDRLQKVDFHADIVGASLNESVSSFIEDMTGLLWVGTYRNGLFHLSQKFGFLTPAGPRENRLITRDILSISSSPSNKIWLGTWGYGISCYNPEPNTIVNFPTDEKFLPIKNIFGLFAESDSLVWVGMWSTDSRPSYGISVYNVRTGVIRHFKDEPGTPFYNDAGIAVIAINADSRGRIWGGTLTSGIWVYDKSKNQFSNLEQLIPESDFLKNSPIHVIFRDSKNRMWVGTRSQGVAMIDETKLTRLRNKEGDNNSLPSNEILSISEDSKGNIWIATGSGVIKYEPKNNTLLRFTSANGVPEGTIYSVVPGDYPFIWMSSNQGVIRLNSVTNTANLINLPEIVHSEFIQGAYGKGKDGTIYFGNLNGLLFFQPRDIETNSQPPEIVLLDVKKFYESVLYSANMSGANNFNFKYNENILTFEFAALDFTHPEINEFEFYLEGFDNKWNRVGKQNFITYTNLSPGDYRLLVRASNSAGVWSVKPYKLSITVIPPFYQQTWFKFTGAFLVIFILSGGYTLRINHLKKVQKKELENQRIIGEINTAREMQANLLPQQLPKSPLFNIDATCRLAFETGGDFYDVFWLNPGKSRLCIISADVSGKAMKASVLSILITGILTSMRREGFENAADALKKMNRALIEKKPEKRMFAALSVAIFDFDKLILNFCNAGQPEILRLSNNELEYISTKDPRTPLGVFRDVDYKDISVPLSGDDVFIFYSDAFPESLNLSGANYGYKRFEESIEKNYLGKINGLGNLLLKDLDAFLNGAPQYDDATMIIIKIEKLNKAN